jgi:hypothetical protein
MSEPAKHTEFVQGTDTIAPCDPLILCARVSTLAQARAGNLKDQVSNLRRIAEERGATVIDVFEHIGPGWDCEWLVPPIDAAKKQGAKLFAESLSRIVRSKSYHPVWDPEAQPSDEQLHRLHDMSDGVPLVTVVAPAAPANEERGYQSKRGQECKSRRGGRPPSKPAGYKLARRHQMLPKVLAMRATGASYSAISQRTGLPRTTVRDWLQREKNPGRIFGCYAVVDDLFPHEIQELSTGQMESGEGGNS